MAQKRRKKTQPKRRARAAPRGGRTAARRRAEPSYKREGMRAVTPNLVVRDCAAAIDWWKRVLRAREESRILAPDGRSIWHAQLRIDDSVVFANDAMGTEVGTGNTSLYVYVPDCDAVFQRAVDGGAEVTMPMMDMFWGDRQGMLKDPWGIHWAIATHKEDLAPDEIARRGAEFVRQMAERGGQPG